MRFGHVWQDSCLRFQARLTIRRLSGEFSSVGGSFSLVTRSELAVSSVFRYDHWHESSPVETVALVLGLRCCARFRRAADDGATKEGVAYFEQHIRPLLAERCYACHSTREKKQKGGLLLDSRAGWAQGGDQGPAVVPGDLDASLLIRAVRYTDPDLRMPPDRPLPKEAVARLERWVKMGAPDPREGLAA